MSAVGIAVAAIGIPVIGIRVGLIWPKGPRVIERHERTDAMRPRIIAADGHTFGRPPFHGEQHAVIPLNSSRIRPGHVSDFCSVCRPLKTERAARIHIAERRARSGLRQSKLPGTAVSGDDNGRIEGLIAPQMNHVVSQVSCGNKPVLPNLLLDAEVPRLLVGRGHVEGLGINPTVGSIGEFLFTSYGKRSPPGTPRYGLSKPPAGLVSVMRPPQGPVPE